MATHDLGEVIIIIIIVLIMMIIYVLIMIIVCLTIIMMVVVTVVRIETISFILALAKETDISCASALAVVGRGARRGFEKRG